MDRKDLHTLYRWLQSKQRKPLVIRGARQVGKTWLVRQLAVLSKKKLVELNFERRPNLVSLFHTNDPHKILLAIEAALNITIEPEQSILFLDEIQAAPHIFAKLRWFAEELPALAVVAAGSLLEFVLGKHDFSMPVGRISYLHLEPISFQEFILATGYEKLLAFLEHYQLSDKIPQAIHERLWELIGEYLIVGGMPAVVNSWAEAKSLAKISEIQHDLLATYRDDFTKYSSKINHERLEEVLIATPKLLGQKFKYVAVNPDVQASSIKIALNLLCKAHLCYKVNGCAGNSIPLAAEIKSKIFKVILLDIGLVCALQDLSLPNILRFRDLQLANQGKLAEQLVGQMLRTVRPSYIEPTLYYWAREQKGSAAEIDYLFQYQGEIIPIEVKAGSTGTLKSLHLFMALKNLKTAIRINADYPSITNVQTKTYTNQQVTYQLISIPMYLTEQIDRLLRPFVIM